MGVSYIVEDPWEKFVYKFSEMMKDHFEIKISYGGMEAGVNFDVKALENLANLFEKGVPLEVAVGIDLPKILASIEGEELNINFRTKDAEMSFKLRGNTLSEFKKAMQQNPLDEEVLLIISKFLKKLVK